MNPEVEWVRQRYIQLRNALPNPKRTTTKRGLNDDASCVGSDGDTVWKPVPTRLGVGIGHEFLAWWDPESRHRIQGEYTHVWQLLEWLHEALVLRHLAFCVYGTTMFDSTDWQQFWTWNGEEVLYALRQWLLQTQRSQRIRSVRDELARFYHRVLLLAVGRLHADTTLSEDERKTRRAVVGHLLWFVYVLVYT